MNNIPIVDLIIAIASTFTTLLMLSKSFVYNSIKRIQNKNGNVSTDTLPSISIIITAHDQSRELSENLPKIFQQEYVGKFEVIVVNDASTDDTEDVLKRMTSDHDNFYFTFTPDTARYVSHKKLAITLGIKAAKYDWIMLTDADCYPSTNLWLKQLASNCHDGMDVISGVSNYETNIDCSFIRHITFHRVKILMRQCFRAMLGMKIYRASGTNLLFRKQLFVDNKGFSKNLNLSRGEDDLLVCEIIKNDNFFIDTNKDALVLQQPPIVGKIWKTDRVFYIETQRHLPFMAQLFDKYVSATADFVYFATIVFGVCGIVFSIINNDWYILPVYPILWILLWIVNAFFFNRSLKAIGCDYRYVLRLPFYQIGYIIDEIRFRFIHAFKRKSEFMRK